MSAIINTNTNTNTNKNSILQPEAQKYSDNITNLSQQFFSILADFKKYYVFFNKNPEVNEYANFYLNSKTQLQNVNKQLFETTTNIENGIILLNNLVNQYNRKLLYEKELHQELMEIIGGLKNSKLGAATMLLDTKYSHNKQYYWNMEIGGGICIVTVLLFTLFRKGNKQ